MVGISWQEFCAVWAIGQHPRSSTNLTPWLISLTQRTNMAPNQFPASVWALGQLHSDPDRSIPLLTNLLISTNFMMPETAAEALGHFGPAARCALPKLRELRSDPRKGYAFKAAIAAIGSDDSTNAPLH